MKQFFTEASRSFASAIANTLLLAIAAAIVTSALTLTALYLTEYLEETPALKSLQCFVGFSRPDCPRYAEEMTNLKANLEAMIKERQKLDRQLAGLRAVETAVDEITLFESHIDPASGRSITIGTVYAEFVDASPAPEYHFCYINLSDGTAGENRNLYFQNRNGEITIASGTLRQAGVSRATLSYARSVCKAFKI